MSTSSSDEVFRMAGHRVTSFRWESTGSLLSDSSDVHLTPRTSPASSEGKTRMPMEFLDASRRLRNISIVASQGDSDRIPSKYLESLHHLTSLKPVADEEEAGYDADGDGDADRDGDGGSCARAGNPAATRHIRRPAFLRVDTRQHRRVASLLAIRRPTSPIPGFEELDIPRPPRAKLIALPSVRSKHPVARKANIESFELRRRPRAEQVGLGIGFPENHPLRGRAFSMPVHAPVSSLSGLDGDEKWQVEQERGWGRQSEWLPSGLQVQPKKKPRHVDAYPPSPVLLALRPTFLEVSPSPIECLPALAGTGRARLGLS